MNPLRQVLDWPVPNAAAAVLGPDGVLVEIGDADRRFELASVTKPLAALATLVAVEEGAVELDRPVLEWASATAPDALSEELTAELGTMTLRHLLAHASGLAPDAYRRAAEVGT
ncbi:MAG: beta-lactamase family protein, partial [Actinobacteria bacterium]|nr:beta-lactamase family protein [Actinomycetota bacterium]